MLQLPLLATLCCLAAATRDDARLHSRAASSAGEGWDALLHHRKLRYGSRRRACNPTIKCAWGLSGGLQNCSYGQDSIGSCPTECGTFTVDCKCVSKEAARAGNESDARAYSTIIVLFMIGSVYCLLNLRAGLKNAERAREACETAAHQTAAPTVQVQVPPGMGPGMQMMVSAPGLKPFVAVIPPNTGGGQFFSIAAPLPTLSPVSGGCIEMVGPPGTGSPSSAGLVGAAHGASSGVGGPHSCAPSAQDRAYIIGVGRYRAIGALLLFCASMGLLIYSLTYDRDQYWNGCG